MSERSVFPAEALPLIYVVTEGEGKVSGDGYTKDVKKGDYFLVPVAAQDKFKLSGNMSVVECYR